MIDELLKKIEKFIRDAEDIKRRFFDDEQFYRECVIDFLNDNHFNEFNQAMKENNIAGMISSSHALKGVAATIGLGTIYELLVQIVIKLRSNEVETIETLWTECVNEVKELQQTIKDA